MNSTIEALAATPARVAALAEGLAEAELLWRPDDLSFSFVEHACHLRDLEAEGYAVRIARLRNEEQPALAGFDGTRVAAERDYRAESFADALAAFARLRAANVAAIEALSASELAREGTLDGTPITLADVLEAMCRHDAEHLEELERLRLNPAR